MSKNLYKIISLILGISTICFAQMIKINNTYYSDKAKFLTEEQITLTTSQKSDDDANIKTLIEDFTINTHDGEADADQTSPAMAIDGNGNYAITWIDNRDGDENIYAQFYNSKDQAVGENVLVSDEPLNWNSDPAIDCNSSGDFLISWAPQHNKIVAQRFTYDGVKVDSNFQIVSGYVVFEPSISVFEDGSFVVCWAYDVYSYSNRDLYIAKYNAENNIVFEELRINDVNGRAGTSFGWGRRIASDTNGDMVITWSDYVNNQNEIFIQRVNNDGVKYGENIIVSDTSYHSDNYFPSVAASGNGYFIVSWKSDDGINYRIFNYESGFVTDHIRYSIDGWQYQYVSSNRKDRFLLTWLDEGLKILYLSVDGTVLSGPDVSWTTPDSTEFFYTPQVSNLVNDYFYIVFPQNDINDGNIYSLKFDSGLNSEWTNPRQTGEKQGSAWQIKPLVFFNDYGQSIVLWEDHRLGRYDLYGQVFDKDFKPVGKNIKINDDFPEPTEGHRFVKNPAVASFINGDFIIAFNAGQTIYDGFVFLQKVSSSGDKINGNLLVEKEYDIQKMDLYVNNNNRLIICWYRDGAVYRFNRKIYNENLDIVSGRATYEMGRTLRPFALSINEKLNIFISFGFYNSNGKNFYGLIFDKSGEIDTDTLYFPFMDSYPSYRMDNCIDSNDNVVITGYNDNIVNIIRKYTNDDKIYISEYPTDSYGTYYADVLKFKSAKSIIKCVNGYETVLYFINDNNQDKELLNIYKYPSSTAYDMLNNYSAVFNDVIFFVYESKENIARGYDILGSILQFNGFDFDPEIYREPVNKDILYPNFPNPFNGKTIIPYRIFSYFKVKISLYDVTGREVRILVNTWQDKGYYEIELDSSDLSSGLYFIRMEAFHTYTRKILVIK